MREKNKEAQEKNNGKEGLNRKDDRIFAAQTNSWNMSTDGPSELSITCDAEILAMAMDVRLLTPEYHETMFSQRV